MSDSEPKVKSEESPQEILNTKTPKKNKLWEYINVHQGALTAIATIVLAISTLVFAILTHYDAAEQAQITSRQLSVMESTRRPWVKATVTFASPPQLVEWNGQKGINISMRFELKNFGDSPAVNVRVVSIIVVYPKKEELDAKQKIACDQSRVMADSNPIGGITVFPGESSFVDQGAGITGIYKTNESHIFSISGCIDYTYAGIRHVQTGFRMILGHVEQKKIVGIPFVEGNPRPNAEPISPELLAKGYPTLPPKIFTLKSEDVLFRMDYEGNYAN